MDKNEGQCPRFVHNFAFCPYYYEEKKEGRNNKRHN